MQNDQWRPENDQQQPPNAASPDAPLLSPVYGGEGVPNPNDPTVLAYSASEPSGLASPKLDRWGGRIAWLIIFAAVALTAYYAVQYTRAMDRLMSGTAGGASERIPAHHINPTLTMQAKAVLGMRQVVGSEETSLTTQLRSAVHTPAEEVWIVPVIAEVEGKDAALKQLDAVAPANANVPAPVARDADDLRKLYTSGVDSLSPEERTRIVSRLGWSGKLALTFGQKETDPQRTQLLEDASTFSVVQLVLVLVVMLATVVGLVLLIIAIVKLSKRRLRLRYELEIQPGGMVEARQPAAASSFAGGLTPPFLPPLPPNAAQTPIAPSYAPPAMYSNYGWPAGGSPYWMMPAMPAPPEPPAPPYRLGKLGDTNGRTGPFIEAFAVYLLAYLGLGFLLHHFLDASKTGIAQWLAFAAAPIAMSWPWLRGVRGAAWRRGFGWTRGRGVFREMFAGVVAYIAGLPFFGLSFLLVVLLQKLTQAHSYHPITTETGGADGSPWAAINILLIAAVAAPLIEETFFRGAMFHYLRSRWSWILTALISSLIFAGVHPQGWVAIPALASLAIVFCAMREWRSSCIASMTAHALHNGTLVMLLVLGTT